MKKYEIMYIVKANLDEEARKAEIEKVNAIITNNNGKVNNVNEWGLRDLAYSINDEIKGYYVVIKAEAETSTINEFDRVTKLDNNVLRHLVTVDQD